MYVLVGMLLIAALLFALWRMSSSLNPGVGGRNGPRPSRPAARKPTRSEPVAPDDNPEFLRELDRRTRREDDPPA